MVTDKQVEKALSIAVKKAVEHAEAQANFDRIAGEYFGIDDFSRIYANHDLIVDSVVYGDGNLTFRQLKKEVEDFKNDKREQG